MPSIGGSGGGSPSGGSGIGGAGGPGSVGSPTGGGPSGIRRTGRGDYRGQAPSPNYFNTSRKDFPWAGDTKWGSQKRKEKEKADALKEKEKKKKEKERKNRSLLTGYQPPNTARKTLLAGDDDNTQLV